ncbi:DUF3987 domain-containing protein [Vineibacter terrae]|uniref:DUF3987 domain-containing protein n=1 Tax=Vineibacter terrae TaxID=2586908 RepID=UPI002E37C3C4|nr:DUF3987 domain-containing protein [Vineibacter terrae]HEX2887842.1 DUF3987 domain-containing protein [Vineibacter terrae]
MAAPAVAAAPEDAPIAWPAPDLSLLEDRQSALPAFPLDRLPPAWRRWTAHAAHGASAPVDHVALSLLTGAAGLIGAARRIAPSPSWSESCVLWTALIGPPSSGKTPALATSLRLVQAMAQAQQADFDDAGNRRAAAQADQRERWKAAIKHAIRNRLPWPDMPAAPLPARPETRPLALDDAGIETLAGALQATPRGLLLTRDGSSPWLRDMVRGRGGLWLSAWSGIACSVVPKDGPPIRIDCPAVSVLGTARPDAIAAAFAGDDDSIAARFLFAWPLRPPFQALADAVPPADDAAAALARLQHLPDGPRDMPLTPEALLVLDRFRRTHYADASGLQGREAAWWGKGPGTVLRLAGVLTLLDEAMGVADMSEPAQVPAWAMQSAASLWRDYLWPHARAVLGMAGASAHHHHARLVLRWLARRSLDGVSREQVRREALAQAVNAAGADQVIELLVDAGWLRAIEQRVGSRGPLRRRWLVNPALRSQTLLPAVAMLRSP